jgi:hypothetical protein
MFDWMLPERHAIAVLKRDHDEVKDLFDRFEKSDSEAEKERILEEAVLKLKIHAVVEEEIFYPAVRKHIGRDVMNEADEEHHIAKVLIAELDAGKGGDHREAKFTVLSESVRHHIREEENEMLPKAKEVDLDFEALGDKILARKAELEADGVPADAEHAMVAKARGKEDSPAVAARRRSSTAPVKKAARKRTATAKKRPSTRAAH